jgi:hypothetical protein
MRDGIKFCPSCGSPAGGGAPAQAAPAVPRSPKEGEVMKCPSCGAQASAFDLKCPECGYEFRNRAATQSSNEFFQRYSAAKGADRIAILRSFPIPNAREDILAFLTMVICKTKPLSMQEENEYVSLKGSFVGGENAGQRELRERKAEIAAWQSKVQQTIELGKMLFQDPESKALVAKYEKQLHRNVHKLNRTAIVGIGIGAVVLLVALLVISLFIFRPAGSGSAKKKVTVDSITFSGSAEEVSENLNTLMTMFYRLYVGDQIKGKGTIILQKYELGVLKLKELNADTADYYQQKYDELISAREKAIGEAEAERLRREEASRANAGKPLLESFRDDFIGPKK